MDCIFCKIINGDIPSYTILEDNVVKVFLDANPDTNGHLLIVPKEHTLDITTIDENTLNHILNLVNPLKVYLEEKLAIDGLTLIQNNGGCQHVKHFHLHLKPFYKEKTVLKNTADIYEILKGFKN